MEFEADSWYFDFNGRDGKVSFGSYSYYIDSWGEGELSKEETAQLFAAMKEYYKD